MAFVVSWSIDIENVDTPEEAAGEALRIMRDPASIATVFDVLDCDTNTVHRVDLDEDQSF